MVAIVIVNFLYLLYIKIWYIYPSVSESCLSCIDSSNELRYNINPSVELIKSSGTKICKSSNNQERDHTNQSFIHTANTWFNNRWNPVIFALSSLTGNDEKVHTVRYIINTIHYSRDIWTFHSEIPRQTYNPKLGKLTLQRYFTGTKYLSTYILNTIFISVNLNIRWVNSY